MFVIGGGITGLTAALNALDRGETDVHVFEASKRFGGKIESGFIINPISGEKSLINLGGETVDSEDEGVIALAKRVKVNLIKDSGGQTKEMFWSPDGKPMTDFVKQFEPMHDKLEAVREAMKRDPNLEEAFRNESAERLLTELRDKSPELYLQQLRDRQNPTPVITWLKHAVTNAIVQTGHSLNWMIGRDKRVPKNVIATALNASQHEEGAYASDFTASLFLAEFSPAKDRFLASDCGSRVEGGTAALIDALHKHLEEKGVKFHTGHSLQAWKKSANGQQFTFNTPDGEKTITSPKAIIAMAAYDVGKVKGLENLKLQQNPVQYTKNAKITFAIKPGLDLPDVNAWLKSSQCWSSDPGKSLTFLCHNPKGESREVMVKRAMEDYAKAAGMRPEDIFFVQDGKPQPGTFLYTNTSKSCWSTPSPKTAAANKVMFQKMEAMAKDGLAFAGTYFPDPSGCVGFMNCGVLAAENACNQMLGKARGQEQDISLAQELSPTRQPFMDRLRNQPAPNKGMSI